MHVKSRTATRAVPATPAAGQLKPQAASSGPNIGAIAGGTVGGVIALIALITIVLLCLRRRRSKQAAPNQPDLDPNATPELDAPTASQKPFANYSVSDGITMPPSTTPTPAYSPQASPPPASNSWTAEQHYYRGPPPHHGGDWTHQSGQTYRLPYYPPPPDSSTAKQMDPRDISAELPEVRSPANGELADVRSPLSGELPGVRYTVPVREL